MLLDRLEALPVGRFHYKLLLVTGLGWLFDSMDTGSSPLSCRTCQRMGPGSGADGPYRQHRPHRHGSWRRRIRYGSGPHWPQESLYDYGLII